MTEITPADVEAIAKALFEAFPGIPAPGPGAWSQVWRQQATALLTSPALATLRAHERANALRDAADELHRLWVKDGRHYGHPGCYSSGYEVWLRDRADRQE